MRLFGRKIVLATSAPVERALPPIAIGATNPVTGESPNEVELYLVNVYCCNCSPAFHFDVALPRGEVVSGWRVKCPNCGVASLLNHYHQAWPISRGYDRR